MREASSPSVPLTHNDPGALPVYRIATGTSGAEICSLRTSRVSLQPQCTPNGVSTMAYPTSPTTLAISPPWLVMSTIVPSHHDRQHELHQPPLEHKSTVPPPLVHSIPTTSWYEVATGEGRYRPTVTPSPSLSH